MKPFRQRRLLQTLCAGGALVWILGAIAPVSRGDWLLENLLVAVALPFLIVGHRRRPLSDRAYVLIAIFFVLHQLGAHYTYAKVPIGDWLREALGLKRNHFDRAVHFSFGLLLTRPVAEALRVRELQPSWAAVLPVTVVASLSGAYEIVEAVAAWCVAPELGQAYLGTQGDVWDGQKDMALAILGSALAVASIQLFPGALRRSRSTPQDRIA